MVVGVCCGFVCVGDVVVDVGFVGFWVVFY